MASPNDFPVAMANRSLRTIRTELEFLTDANVITPHQLSEILHQLPPQTQLHAPVTPAPVEEVAPAPAPVPVVPIQAPTPSYPAPVNQFSNLGLNEKSPVQNQYSPPTQAPPPAYASGPPVLSIASALYAYTPTDAGDLALQPHDRIQVLEHMNADWWRGRNERTGLEGIFPRSYVNVVEEKALQPGVPPPTNYGNMPLEVSQTGGSSASQDGKKPSKFEANGKKFGKKMGNAAIFGAGATIGSNIVNGIF